MTSGFQVSTASLIFPHILVKDSFRCLDQSFKSLMTAEIHKMSTPHRDSGYRSGFSGGRGTHRGFTASASSSDPNCFSVHPRSRFDRVGLKSDGLDVQEIGFYSLEGAGKNVTPRYDRNAMRLVTTPCSPNKPVEAKFNLDESFLWEKPDMEYASINEFLPLYCWMKDKALDDTVQAKRDKIDFITSKGILSEIVKIPYNEDSKDAQGWVFGAARINGKIVLGKVEHRETDRVFLQNRTEAKRILESKPGTYRGRRFEIRMTQTKEDGSTGHIGYSPFRSVLNVTLKDLNLLVEAGVDAADPECKDGYPKKYVEFTILPVQMLTPTRRQVSLLYKERFLRWWANSVFIGLGTVDVGVHCDGKISEIRAYRLADIPQDVKDKESEIEESLWSDNICLGFLYELLKYVQRIVQDDHKTRLYEFTCSKDTYTFSYKTISADDRASANHTYLPESSVDF